MAETAELNGHDTEWLEAQDAEQMRQFILQATDRPEELVEVPEWRVKVLVRAMSGSQRVLYEALPRDEKTRFFKDMRQMGFEVIRMCCVHPGTHKAIFQVADKDTVMDEKNGTVIDFLVGKALRLSGLLAYLEEDDERAIYRMAKAFSLVAQAPSGPASEEVIDTTAPEFATQFKGFTGIKYG